MSNSQDEDVLFYARLGGSIYAGDIIIAKIAVDNEGNNELLLLQGMSPEDTIQKINQDIPGFLAEYGVSDSARAKLFSCGCGGAPTPR